MPINRNTVTRAEATPRCSMMAASTTAVAVGAMMSPNPAPASARCVAMTR